MMSGLFETLASILGLSLVSGINLYAAILTVGFGQKYGWITGLPPEMEVLSHPIVLTLAGVFYAAEFVADKVPFVTPVWDAIHTFIRPLGGALLALQAAGDLSPMAQAAAAIIGGSIALGTHSTKAGVRLLAHATPEPVSHSAISILEDFSVVGLLVLAYKYPEIAVPVFLALLVGVILITPLLFRVLKFVASTALGRVHSFFGTADARDLPRWVVTHSPAVRVFTRSGARLGRLRETYLIAATGRVDAVQKRWGKTSAHEVAGAAVIESGMMIDVLRFGSHSFYVTKDWSKHCRRAFGGDQSSAVSDQLTSAVLKG